MISSPLLVSSFTLLLLTIPILFFVAPRILPIKPKEEPLVISLPDELDDLALFQRASATSSLSGVVFSNARFQQRQRQQSSAPPQKIAFLFLTNTELHFAPLWERFFAGHRHREQFNIYIHADPAEQVPSPGGVFQGRFIRGKRTQRSSPTLISAARRLLAAALIDDESNAFFALLSQHCIPLHSFQTFYSSIFSDAVPRRQSFIEVLSDEPGLWDRYTARGDDVMMPEVPFSRFRVGSQFFVLTREHAALIVRDRRLWRKFRLPCRKKDSCYPEEHYFPTLLDMEDPAGVRPFTLTSVNWTGSTGGHPHTYGAAEIGEQLIQTLRHTPPDGNSTRRKELPQTYYFARKFSPDCLDPLMKLADSFIFKD